MSDTTRQTVLLHVNGREHALDIEPRMSLLDVLRDELHLTASKLGCNRGASGACTVLVEGERVNACLALAVQFDGHAITTLEGVAQDGHLHPPQAAFVAHDGFQCGYCTPGQICSAIGMAREFRRHLPSALAADLAAPRLRMPPSPAGASRRWVCRRRERHRACSSS